MSNQTYLVQIVEFKLRKDSPYKKALGLFHYTIQGELNFNLTPCTIIPLGDMAPITYFYHPRMEGSVYGVRMENERCGVRAIFNVELADLDLRMKKYQDIMDKLET